MTISGGSLQLTGELTAGARAHPPYSNPVPPIYCDLPIHYNTFIISFSFQSAPLYTSNSQVFTSCKPLKVFSS